MARPIESSLPARWRRGSVSIAAALVIATIFAYLPALWAGFIWDDPDYVTGNWTLRTLHGLWAIWFQPSALPQYYPLVHTTFWIEYHLWNLSPAGYHFDNVLLHAASALVLWRLLDRIGIPGGPIAAALFALHPINVESVAWVTERKNVLSGLLYLLALHVYFRQGAERFIFNRRAYAIVLIFFVAALLSKSVTSTLPATILIIQWYRGGRLARRQIAAVLPMIAVGLAMGLVTARLEVTHVGATGTEWTLSLAQRCIIAARAVWFYAGKVLAPVSLTFVYPRWSIDPHDAAEWFWPMALLATLTGFAVLAFTRGHPGKREDLDDATVTRQRAARAPLAGAIYFIITLAPALGLINIYPMRYTFVADHYAYLASLGLIVPAAALLCARRGEANVSSARGLRIGLTAVILVALGLLTARQSEIYRDPMTLWTDTQTKNPNSWMVHANIAAACLTSPQPDLARARAEFEIAARLEPPDVPEGEFAMGSMDQANRNFDAARADYRRVLNKDPHYAQAYVAIGEMENQLHHLDEAATAWRTAIQLNPRLPGPHYDLGTLAEQAGDFPSAEAEYRAELALRPDFNMANFNLGNLLLVHKNDPAGAIPYFRAALNENPDQPQVLTNLGWAMLFSGDKAGAVDEFRRALELQPNLLPAQQGLARARG